MMPMQQQMMEEQQRKRQVECGPLYYLIGCFPGPGKDYNPADVKAKDFDHEC
jgi:hypothetical protein